MTTPPPTQTDPRVEAVAAVLFDQWDAQERERVVEILAAADAVDPARERVLVPDEIELDPMRIGEALAGAVARNEQLVGLVDEILGTFDDRATAGKAVVRSTWQLPDRIEAWRARAHA